MLEFYSTVGMRNPSRSYFVNYMGRLHSLKAVVTFALQQDVPDTRARDFHAADAADRLEALQFAVVHGAVLAEEERERVWLERLARPGQRTFRDKLIDIFGCCPLSGCTTPRVLEAAHVDQVSYNGSDSTENGILLRSDLHKLFDYDLLAIDPDSGRVSLASSCAADYGEALKDSIFVPPEGGPMLDRFRSRWVKHMAVKLRG